VHFPIHSRQLPFPILSPLNPINALYPICLICLVHSLLNSCFECMRRLKLSPRSVPILRLILILSYIYSQVFGVVSSLHSSQVQLFTHFSSPHASSMPRQSHPPCPSPLSVCLMVYTEYQDVGRLLSPFHSCMRYRCEG
jgi:hypothetical protein